MTAGPVRPLNRRRWLAISLGTGLALAARAGEPPTGPATGFQISDWPRQRAVPALDALSLQSNPVRLSDFRGRVLVLNFWATWCPPCRAELPTLRALPDWFGEDKVAVLALNFQEAGRTVRRFLETSDLKLPVALDPSGDIARAWGIRAFPTTVLVDRQGKPRQIVQGEVDWASATALGWIERLLAAR